MLAVLLSLPSNSSCTCASCPARRSLAVILRNNQRQQNAATIHRPINVGGPRRIAGDREIRRPAELPDQFAAFGSLIAIVDQRRDLVHVKAESVPEQHQHDEWKRQRQDKAAHVTYDVQEFLARDGSSAPQVHAAVL